MKRCDITDLYENQCAHCLKQPDPFKPDELDPSELGVSFMAEFRGNCANCGKGIQRGDIIAAMVDGSGYVCEKCLP